MKKITLLAALFVATIGLKAQTTVVSTDFTTAPDGNWGTVAGLLVDGPEVKTKDSYKFKAGGAVASGQLVMTATAAGKLKVGIKFTNFTEFAVGESYKFTAEVKSTEDVDMFLRFGGAAGVVQTAMTKQPYPNYTVIERTITLNDLTGLTKIQFEIRGKGTSANQVVSVKNWKIENVTALSTNEYSNKVNFSLYPNPASDNLTIKSATQIAEVKIMDITGKQVVKVANYNNENINIAALSAGVYMVSVKDVNNNLSVKKLLIAK